MNTGSSTPSTTSIVSRWVSVLFGLMAVPASMDDWRAYGRRHGRSCPCSTLRVLDRLPDRERRRRHRDVADAVVAQRIDDGADDHRERRRGAAFAAGLDAERIGRRQHLDDLGLERRQGVRARHAVIHERAGERLAGGGINVALLPQRLAHALRDAAMRLAVDDQRIDAAADVVDRGVARDRRLRRCRDRPRPRRSRSRSGTPDRASRCRRRSASPSFSSAAA